MFETVAEHLRVDLLVDVADACAPLVVSGDVRLVDVADFARFDLLQIAVNLEVPGNVVNLGQVVGTHDGIGIGPGEGGTDIAGLEAKNLGTTGFWSLPAVVLPLRAPSHRIP